MNGSRVPGPTSSCRWTRSDYHLSSTTLSGFGEDHGSDQFTSVSWLATAGHGPAQHEGRDPRGRYSALGWPRRPSVKPKPMVEIGGRPILWHIMKHYAHYGLQRLRDRARATRATYIKRYMVDYAPVASDLHGAMSCSGDVLPSATATVDGLDRSPGRHRHEHADRRPDQAPRAVTSATRRSC